MLPTAYKSLERWDLKSVRPPTLSLRGDPLFVFQTGYSKTPNLIFKKSACCWFLNKGCKLQNQGGRFLIWFLNSEDYFCVSYFYLSFCSKEKYCRLRKRSLIMAGRGLEGKLKIFNKISQPIRILQNGFVAQQ